MKRLRIAATRMVFLLGIIIAMTLMWTGFFMHSLQFDSKMSFTDFTLLSNFTNLGKAWAVRILLVTLSCVGAGYASRKIFVSMDTHVEMEIRFPSKMIILIAGGFFLSTLITLDNFSAISYFLNVLFLIFILVMYIFLSLDQNSWDWLFAKPKAYRKI